MKIICVIPARYASTRLPGKPLADIAGKPMIVRVYERVLNATKPAEVIAAVDDERVYEAVVKAGGKAIMTAKNHPTGTDRLAEVAQKCPDADVIINVQGDEPLIDPQIIEDLAQEFLNDENLMGFFEISYTNWIGSHNIYLQQNIFYMAIPILATLPFGSSFYDDINRGYARNVCVRAKKKYYLVAKYIAVFVSGGCVVAIPMVLSFLISSIFLPTMLPEASYTFTNIYPAYKWADLFYVQPLLYTSIYIFITFLFSGVTASLSLFITFFLNRKFVTFVFPFFIPGTRTINGT